MRVLVTGATGLLGRVLVEDLAEHHEVTALVHSRKLGKAGVAEYTVDLRDDSSLGALWQDKRPELVIHTAAIADLEHCQRNPILARRLNAEAAGNIAELCAQSGSRLVHISTDAVFAGTAGPHREGDAVAPQSVYAETKLAGEAAAMEALPTTLVARVNFFGWSLSGTRSLAEFFYDALSRGEAVRGYADVAFASLYNRDLGAVLVEASAAGIHGVRHVVSSDSMSKFDFGRLVASIFGFDPELVRSSTVSAEDSEVRRTNVLTLSPSLLSRELGRTMPTIEDGLTRMRHDLDSGYVRALRSAGEQPSPSVSSGGNA
jgi:dTDP-4-dehydrorhamnose reductase